MLTSPLTTLLFQSRCIHAILNFVHVISNLSGSIRTGLGREPSPSAEESRAILAKRHHRHYRALDSASVFVTFNALRNNVIRRQSAPFASRGLPTVTRWATRYALTPMVDSDQGLITLFVATRWHH
jgi:hypothetical protein